MPLTTSSRSAPDLQTLVDDVLIVAEEFEHGLADQPISTGLRCSREALSGGPLVVAVLALDNQARDNALSWLTGSTPSAMRLSNRSVSLVNCQTSCRNGADRTLPTATARRSQLENVQIILAPVADTLASNPALLPLFSTRADILLLAWTGPVANHPEARLDFCTSLLDDFTAIGVVHAASGSHTNDGLYKASSLPDYEKPSAATGFLRRIDHHRGLLWRVDVSAQDATRAREAIPPLGSGMRRALQKSRVAYTARAASDALGFRVASRSVQLGRELELLARQKKSAGRRGKSKKPLAEARYQAASRLTALQNDLVSSSARSMQPLGELSQLMQEAVSELELATLEVDTTANAVSYRVDASHLSRIGRRLSEKLQEDLDSGIRTINEGVSSVAREAEEKAEAQLGEAVTIRWAEIAGEPIWGSIRNSLQIGRDAQIDLPRRGLVDMLTAGRQKVFILVMLTGLAGRIGFSKEVLSQFGLDSYSGPMSAGFTLLAVTVFIGSMLDAVLRWRREAEAQADKEMQKIKETIYAEGMKLFDQSQKTKLNFAKEYLKETAKQIDRQLEDAESEIAERDQIDAEDAKEGLETATKRAEQEKKRTEETRKKLDKIGGLIVAAVSTAEEAVRDATLGASRGETVTKPPRESAATAKAALKRSENRSADSSKASQRPRAKGESSPRRVGGVSAVASPRARRTRSKTPTTATTRRRKTAAGSSKPDSSTLQERLKSKRNGEASGQPKPKSSKTKPKRTSLADRMKDRQARKSGAIGQSRDKGKKSGLTAKLAERGTRNNGKRNRTSESLGSKEAESAKATTRSAKSKSRLAKRAEAATASKKKPSDRLAKRKVARASGVVAKTRKNATDSITERAQTKKPAGGSAKKGRGLAERLASRRRKRDNAD